MGRLWVVLAAVALAGLLAVPGQAATVKSKTKVVNVFEEEGDDVGVYARLKTSADCRNERRKFILLDEEGKVKALNGLSDVLFVTGEVGIGDTIQVKTKTVTIRVDGKRTKCKGSTSKEFRITELGTGGF